MIKQWGTFNVRSLLWLFVSGFSSIILQQGVFTASSLTATKLKTYLQAGSPVVMEMQIPAVLG